MCLYIYIYSVCYVRSLKLLIGFLFYRPLTHSKRQKRSTSDTSSHSAYSSSSQTHSSQSSYSSRSSSPSHSDRSRSSSYSAHSRSLSSHNSSSYSRSSFSSSSHSSPSDFKSRSKNSRHFHDKTHGVTDKQASSSAKNLQSPMVHNKSWRADIKYQRKEEVIHRDRMSFHRNKTVARSYRPHSRHSRSPPRLRDRFLEHNKHSSHYSHDFCYRRPSRLSSRERRINDQRRSPPVERNYSRRRMCPSYSPPKLRHRAVYSPTRMQRRYRMHSLDRSRRLIDRNVRSKRLPSAEHERKLGTVELRRKDGCHKPKRMEMMNTNSGERTLGADRGKSNREKRERKEPVERTEK